MREKCAKVGEWQMNCGRSISGSLQCLFYAAASCLVFSGDVAYIDLLAIGQLCRGAHVARLFNGTRDELRLIYGLGLACASAKDRREDPGPGCAARVDVVVAGGTS